MPESLSVEVMLFARAAELAGSRNLPVRLPLGASVGQLRAVLIDQHPQLASLDEISRWAVDSQFVPDDYELRESQRIAMIPPVSGG